jgi:hypothetical protein
MTEGTGDTAEARAEQLKERVYITFTALAVVIALRERVPTAEEAALSLLIVVTGTLLAVFVADVVSHIAVHERLPSREELRHMLRVSFGSLGALALPFVFIGLAVADVWTIAGALRAASIALVAALVVIGYVAARRARLTVWQRLVVLFAEFGLGVAVVGLELLAHG